MVPPLPELARELIMADFGLAGVSSKNSMLSPAASDLGLGDMVRQQLDDDEEERRKKVMRAQAGSGGGMFGSAAASSIFGTSGQ